MKTRDVDVREELAVRFTGLAESLARRYANRGETLDDLQQVAYLGLVKALDGFDDSRGSSFRAYAEPTILGEIRRHFRDKRWAMRVPRDLKEAIPRIRRAIEELEGELGRDPETAEVAERAEMEEEEVLEALEASTASRPSSLEAPVMAEEAEARTLAEVVGESDTNLNDTEWNLLLEDRLEALDDRAREVLYLRFVEDLTQREIGEQVGVSQMQVSRILRASIDELRREEDDFTDEEE